MKEDEDGWWDAPGGDEWVCPECKESSPIEDWREVPVYCEDCGDHDGRECPLCGNVEDHVWGAGRIRKATIK